MRECKTSITFKPTRQNSDNFWFDVSFVVIKRVQWTISPLAQYSFYYDLGRGPIFNCRCPPIFNWRRIERKAGSGGEVSHSTDFYFHDFDICISKLKNTAGKSASSGRHLTNPWPKLKTRQPGTKIPSLHWFAKWVLGWSGGVIRSDLISDNI